MRKPILIASLLMVGLLTWLSTVYLWIGFETGKNPSFQAIDSLLVQISDERRDFDKHASMYDHWFLHHRSAALTNDQMVRFEKQYQGLVYKLKAGETEHNKLVAEYNQRMRRLEREYSRPIVTAWQLLFMKPGRCSRVSRPATPRLQPKQLRRYVKALSSERFFYSACYTTRMEVATFSGGCFWDAPDERSEERVNCFTRDRRNGRGDVSQESTRPGLATVNFRNV